MDTLTLREAVKTFIFILHVPWYVVSKKYACSLMPVREIVEIYLHYAYFHGLQ